MKKAVVYSFVASVIIKHQSQQIDM